MEIISYSSNTIGFQVYVWILSILLVVAIIEFILDLRCDKEVVLPLGCSIVILIVALILCIVKTTDNRLVYVVHINENTSVHELVQKYDIVEYDKQTDTWRVKLKESEE